MLYSNPPMTPQLTLSLMMTFKALSSLIPLPLQTLLLGLPAPLPAHQPHWLLCIPQTCLAPYQLRLHVQFSLPGTLCPRVPGRLPQVPGAPYLLPVSIQMSPSQQCLSWLTCLKFHIHPHFLFAFPVLFFLLSIYNYLLVNNIFSNFHRHLFYYLFVVASLLHRTVATIE